MTKIILFAVAINTSKKRFLSYFDLLSDQNKTGTYCFGKHMISVSSDHLIIPFTTLLQISLGIPFTTLLQITSRIPFTTLTQVAAACDTISLNCSALPSTLSLTAFISIIGISLRIQVIMMPADSMSQISAP